MSLPRVSQTLTHTDPRRAAGGQSAGEDGQEGDDHHPDDRAGGGKQVYQLLVEGEGETLVGEGVGDEPAGEAAGFPVSNIYFEAMRDIYRGDLYMV